MCGIAGFVNRAGHVADRSIVERMTAVLAHRGPDGSGIHCAGQVALGHRRLSIIDVGGGAQPLANEDGTVWITYNGELYNELELRPELERRGHCYRTASDTESLVHLYEEHGLVFVSQLNGMFAFGLWDATRSRLLLARDRMGQKPLYYAELSGGGLAFGSESKAVLAHPEVGRALDQQGLARYLFYEYLPAPYSIWQKLRKLPRGHLLVWEDGALTITSYWDSFLPTEACGSVTPSRGTAARMSRSVSFCPVASTPRALQQRSVKWYRRGTSAPSR
jgi:asparagine synthase (glutamine-hydrolysing)